MKQTLGLRLGNSAKPLPQETVGSEAAGASSLTGLTFLIADATGSTELLEKLVLLELLVLLMTKHRQLRCLPFPEEAVSPSCLSISPVSVS